MSLSSGCVLVSRAIFAIINFIILLIGIAVLGIGIYLQVEAKKYTFVTGDDHVGPPLLLASGCLTATIAAIGFFGACLKSKALLFIYAVVLIIIVILEIIAGIFGAVYSNTATDKFETKYNEKLKEAIEDYSTNSNAKRTLDYLQKEFECCGVNDASDWSLNAKYLNGSDGELPESCQCDDNSTACGVFPPFFYNVSGSLIEYDSENTVWMKGCYNDTVTLLERLAVVYAGVGLAFGLFEIIGIIFACGLLLCIVKTTKEYEVV